MRDSIAIIGFGSQGKSWALNLKDSNQNVLVALRENSSSKNKAKEAGFNVINYKELKNVKAIALLIPDHLHGEALKEITPFLSKESKIIYAHGFSLTAKSLHENYPFFSHILLAPKAIASELREKYIARESLYAAFSTEFTLNPQVEKEWIKNFSIDLGIAPSNQVETTFEEETKADLFSEQSLLCSLIPYGALHSYNSLRKNGVSKKVAFIECWMEVKLIADAMIKYGPEELFKLISPNALAGGEKAQKLFFDEQYEEKLSSILDEIWNNSFFTELEKTDIASLKNEVNLFWKNQEISKTFKEFN